MFLPHVKPHRWHCSNVLCECPWLQDVCSLTYITLRLLLQAIIFEQSSSDASWEGMHMSRSSTGMEWWCRLQLKTIWSSASSPVCPKNLNCSDSCWLYFGAWAHRDFWQKSSVCTYPVQKENFNSLWMYFLLQWVKDINSAVKNALLLNISLS